MSDCGCIFTLPALAQSNGAVQEEKGKNIGRRAEQADEAVRFHATGSMDCSASQDRWDLQTVNAVGQTMWLFPLVLYLNSFKL